MPLTVFAGLVIWIFVSAGRPKAMTAEPVGQGASETGGANAIGEWLAGRNPNDVVRADIARREGRVIDPFVWPGGIEIIVKSDPSVPVSFGWVDEKTGLLRSVVLNRRDDAWRVVLIDHRPAAGADVYLSAGPMSQRIRSGARNVIDENGVTISSFVIDPFVPGDTIASEPLPLRLGLPD